MRRTIRSMLLIATVAIPAWMMSAHGQDSFDQPRASRVLEFPNLGPIPGTSTSSFGPPPGGLDTDMATAAPNVIGGRRRSSVLPRGIGGRARTATVSRSTESLPPPRTAPAEPPERIAMPTTDIDGSTAVDDGEPGGITLDEAIERMMAANLDIRAIRHELPQADADILTAGLRTNPLVYVDTQFIPYGSFNDRRPGGPTQYDLNVTLPLDVSQKRKARVVVARMAKSALESQFQDLVRRQIDAVYRGFVSLQAARLDVLAANAAVGRCERLLSDADRAAAATEQVERLSLILERAKLAVIDANEAFADAQESLGVLLNEPPSRVGDLRPGGSLRDTAAPPPPVEDLVRLAIECRPDLIAIRRGVGRAQAEVDLQRANAYDDLYLFYDPITVQDYGPYGRSDASSWAVGLTFSVPLFNRNQGNVARAHTNVSQTRRELSAAERRVESEVRLAEREYRTSRESLERIERRLLPLAAAAARRQAEAFTRGEIDDAALEEAADDAGGTARTHREAVVRHRRSMLDLNTAVGLRLLP